MPGTEPLRLFGELKSKIEEYDRKFADIVSPQAAYENKTLAIRTRITEIWAQLPSTSQPSAISTYQNRIVELGGRLKELELHHKKHLANQEQRYHDALQVAFDALQDDLRGILGLKGTSKPTPPASRTGTHGSQQPYAPSDAPVSTASNSAQKRRPDTRDGTNATSASNPAGKRKDRPSSSHSQPQKRRKVEATEMTTRRQTRNSHRRPQEETTPSREEFEGITDPEPGGVYLSFWERSEEWIPVLVLPLQDLEQAGISGTLESLGLADFLPICYDQDSVGGVRRWRDGYKDGQALVTEREFPVIYFEGRNFPARSSVGWVSAKDLRELDIDAATRNTVPQIRGVRKFLRDRAANQNPRGESEAPDRERDASQGVEDLPRQESSPAWEPDEDDSIVAEIAVAPEESDDEAEPANGDTPEPAFGSTPEPAFGSTPEPTFGDTPEPDFGDDPEPALPDDLEPQSRPQTADSRQARSSVAPAAEPQRQTSTRKSQSRQAEAQPERQKSTQPGPTKGPRSQSPEHASPAIAAPGTPLNDAPSPVLKAEPGIEVISIASSEPDEDDDFPEPRAPRLFTFTTGSRPPDGLPREEARASAERQRQVERQRENQTEARPEPRTAYFAGQGRMQEMPEASLPMQPATTMAPTTAAANPGQAAASYPGQAAVPPVTTSAPDSARPQMNAVEAPTSAVGYQAQATNNVQMNSVPAPTVRLAAYPQGLSAEEVARVVLEQSNPGPPTHAPTGMPSPVDNFMLRPTSGPQQPPQQPPMQHPPMQHPPMQHPPMQQPPMQHMAPGGPTHAPHLNPFQHASPPSIQFTPYNQPVASSIPTPPTTSVALPGISHITGPQPAPPPQNPADLSNNMSNYGLSQAPAPPGLTQAPPGPQLSHFAPPPPPALTPTLRQRQHLQRQQAQNPADPGQGFSLRRPWPREFCPELVNFLEGYLHDKGTTIGMGGLVDANGRLACPFCKPPHQKTYMRQDFFIYHITSHWEGVARHVQRGNNGSGYP